jgi:hypothetical protein
LTNLTPAACRAGHKMAHPSLTLIIFPRRLAQRCGVKFEWVFLNESASGTSALDSISCGQCTLCYAEMTKCLAAKMNPIPFGRATYQAEPPHRSRVDQSQDCYRRSQPTLVVWQQCVMS